MEPVSGQGAFLSSHMVKPEPPPGKGVKGRPPWMQCLHPGMPRGHQVGPHAHRLGPWSPNGGGVYRPYSLWVPALQQVHVCFDAVCYIPSRATCPALPFLPHSILCPLIAVPLRGPPEDCRLSLGICAMAGGAAPFPGSGRMCPAFHLRAHLSSPHITDSGLLGALGH